MWLLFLVLLAKISSMDLPALPSEATEPRERLRQPRGRPRDVWSVAPDARPGGDRPTAYVDLARWLVRMASPGKAMLRGVEATGREIGRDLASTGGDASAEQTLHATLVSLGFQPKREIGSEETTLTYRLRNCPYRDAVRENQPMVCTLHRDPDMAGYLMELRGELADEGRGRAAAVASERPAG